MLSSFAKWLGYALLMAMLAGWIGLIDFRVCGAPKGGCGWRVDEPVEGEPVVRYLTATLSAPQPPEASHV